MPETTYIAIARRALDAIHTTCPHLRFGEKQTEHVDLNVDIPVQEGLAYDINLNLQGDELHFCVGRSFWVEWFPCDDPVVERQFIETVVGFIAGRYRIVEVSRGDRPFLARMERPADGGWETVATSRTFRFPWPGRQTTRILHNGSGTAA